MSAALCAIFVLSGAAALLFETLWFRLAGLALGNSVWASSLVLASFMGGLALGNALAARRDARLDRPVRTYAALEAIVGALGLALVLLLPALTPALAAVFRPWLDRPALLNPLRFLVAFALLLVPTTAMGATLPVLVKALAWRHGFGPALGLLYGCNTLGAVAGALGGELGLIPLLGVRGTALAAAGLNAVAAGVAWLVGREWTAPTTPSTGEGRPDRRLLAAAFLSGGILLALEVVWLRFLLLFVYGTTLAFALILAVVLLGIGAGGLLAAAWLSARPGAWRFVPQLALLAGGVSAAAYAYFAGLVAPHASVYVREPAVVASLGLGLMLPTCILSGLLFALIGSALKEGLAGETRAAGALTLANTTGAMVGALAAGFLLLPRLGMERSFFALAAAYGAVALLALTARRGRSAAPRLEAGSLALAGLVFLTAVGLFPFGLIQHYLKLTAQRFTADGSRVVAVREGLTETILYLRREAWGEPVYYRMLTNGFSMAGTHVVGSRYMKLFAHWPLAVHPRARRVLLISYGVGVTAKALTDASWLESIDVVDISREILEMNRIVYPAAGSSPLDDRRVRVHVEDGRFFLLATDRRYDLITGEPPPPKYAGIANLYSREYFELMRARLAAGGVATYWLPMWDLAPSDGKAIVGAFCAAFDDCSLWSGGALDWMLVGTRGARAPTAAEFTAPWRDPVVGARLRAEGLEQPEQLGAAFLADAPALAELTRDQPPLDDDWPHRLSPRFPRTVDASYFSLMDVDAARARLQASPLFARLWPAELRQGTLDAFRQQAIVNEGLYRFYGIQILGPRARNVFADLHEVLTSTPLVSLPAWLMGSDAELQHAAADAEARGVRDAAVDYHLGARAMAARDYAAAEARLARAGGEPAFSAAVYFRLLALGLAGRRARADELARDLARTVPASAAPAGFWPWFARTFGVADPYGTAPL